MSFRPFFISFNLFTARLNLCLYNLYGENVEKSFSQNVLKTNGRNLQCIIKVVKLFSHSYSQNFVPLGLSALAPGLYTCVKLCNF